MRAATDPLAPLLAAFFRPQRAPRPAEDLPLLARGRRRRFACGLVGWSYGEGPTVPLVHGWQGRGAQLGAFVDPIVRSGRQALLLDGPAHGDSPGVEVDPRRWAEHLVAVGGETGEPAGVVAHSLGAMAAVLAADGGLRADRLVLLSTPKSVVPRRTRVQRLAGLDGPSAQRFADAVDQRVGVPLGDLDLDRSRALYARSRALFVHGGDDQEVPVQDALDVLAVWPGARLLQCSGLGHVNVLLDAVVVAAAVAFLDLTD